MAIIKNPLTIVQSISATNKLPQVIDRTITNITAEDLEGITSVGQYAFAQCNQLTNVVIPEGVTSIEQYAFYYCSSLESISIPNGVTTIGDYAFYYCSSLTGDLVIPDQVTIIGSNAFYNCSSLTTMTILATTPPTLSRTNAISTATTKIYIPAGTLSAYQSATNWSNFADLFEELPA